VNKHADWSRRNYHRAAVVPGALDCGKQIGPFLEHLRVAVPDLHRHLGAAGIAQPLQPLAQLRLRRGESRRLDQLCGTERLFFRPQKHQVATVIDEITGVGRLVRAVNPLVSLGQRLKRRRHRADDAAELVRLGPVVQRDHRHRSRLGLGARAVGRFALGEDATAKLGADLAPFEIVPVRAPGRFHLADLAARPLGGARHRIVSAVVARHSRPAYFWP
jgi:hypothetical protein